MSENILQKIQAIFPDYNLEKLSTKEAKDIANSSIIKKTNRGRFGTNDLIKIKIGSKKIFSLFTVDEKKFYRLELTTEQ